LFSHGDPGLFQPLVDNLLNHDPYMVLADYSSYAACQRQVDAAYADPAAWSRMSILNSAGSGMFSSDRSIRQYCQDIWQVDPQPIQLAWQNPQDPD
jgi:starch phosphorylase